MTTSLALMLILGMAANALFVKMRLPGLLGMLLLGVLLGPYVLNWLDPDMLRMSGDLRLLALIIILLRAGLGIKREALNRVGVTALKLSCIPGLCEGFAIAFVSIYLLGFSFIEGGILGFIVAAVSPAVVVPPMLNFIDRRVGAKNNVPTLILAGASIDDVFAITLFSAFLGLYGGHHVNIGLQLLGIPLSIVLGIGLGLVVSIVLVRLFTTYYIRSTKKVMMILGVAIFLTAVEKTLKARVEIASLLGVMTIGFILLEKMPEVAAKLAGKFNRIWLFAEILLFMLVGAQVNIHVALDAGLTGLLLIAIGLAARSVGVVLSTFGTPLTSRERFFCIVSYLPKATVQAAIGAIPLSMGVPSGDVILAIAVLSILITAPIGAIGIEYFSKRCLEVESESA
ncbi:cation:proton antiporter [Desulfuromonas sp. CSMB_57]|jgi:NhaP-type Na+/H+ or K+/H+ antiporter|uniref:cation:proton antiporter domain-containing protein n=1 Tax=Desulfuromonas sp. CSMB_57 TaxID=2807629 RepID=UPI001CD7F980|nr:cation:proton antiporter [Desulfuromonas sp. CSMB_57]